MLRLRARALVLVALASAAVLGVVAACDDDGAPTPRPPDAGEEIAAVTPEICPDAAPEAGEVCVLPEGTTCAFGACATPLASCTRGRWRYASNEPPSSACPSPEPPPAESACPPCWPASATCSYGTCDGPDASSNTAVASCPGGTWTLVVRPCGATSDSGADVQRDAGDEDD